MHKPSRLVFAGLLSCLAVGSAANSAPVVSSGTDDFAALDEPEPNGVNTHCQTLHDVPVGRLRLFYVRGFDGFFKIWLPEAADWTIQCDQGELFHALSKSLRLEANLRMYKPKPGEDTSPAKYLAMVGARFKNGIEASGARVTHSDVAALTQGEDNGPLGLDMTIDAPAGHSAPLFPQDSFYATHAGPDGVQFDLHLRAYFRTPAEQAQLRFKAHIALTSFIVSGIDPSAVAKMNSAAAEIATPSRPPAGFAGVSATNFSEKTLSAMKAVLDCTRDAMMARYCAALDRFSAAKPLSPTTSGAWAGSTLELEAGRKTKISDVGEGIHALYLKQSKGSFKSMRASNASESVDMHKALNELHAGYAPSPSGGLMKRIVELTPSEMKALEQKTETLSFIIEEDSDSVTRAFVRENEKEILVVEIWGDGYEMEVGIFPKP